MLTLPRRTVGANRHSLCCKDDEQRMELQDWNGAAIPRHTSWTKRTCG